MTNSGLEGKMTALLAGMNAMGDYAMSLICTEQGLLVASAGEAERSEIAAGLTSLCNDILVRAVRDLSFTRVDEITLVDANLGRFVIRPLPNSRGPRLYLVVQVPRQRSWRRNTSLITRKLDELIAPLIAGANPPQPAPPSDDDDDDA